MQNAEWDAGKWKSESLGRSARRQKRAIRVVYCVRGGTQYKEMLSHRGATVNKTLTIKTRGKRKERPRDCFAKIPKGLARACIDVRRGLEEGAS